MRWLLRVAVSLVLVVLIVAGVGFLLPSRYKVERSVEIAAAPGRIYALIVDPREWKRWTVWNQRDPAMTMQYAGAPSGAGAKWSWTSKTQGSGAMTFTDAKADERIGYALVFPEFGMQSSGALTIAPAAPGRVRVVWTNEGALGVNPLSRWFGVFMDRLVGPDFEAGLTNLKRLAEAG